MLARGHPRFSSACRMGGGLPYSMHGVLLEGKRRAVPQL